jgi:hypothetical protein
VGAARGCKNLAAASAQDLADLDGAAAVLIRLGAYIQPRILTDACLIREDVTRAATDRMVLARQVPGGDDPPGADPLTPGPLM